MFIAECKPTNFHLYWSMIQYDSFPIEQQPMELKLIFTLSDGSLLPPIQLRGN